MKNKLSLLRHYGINQSLRFALEETKGLIKRKVFNIFGQHDEDIIAEKLLKPTSSLFYVDVGANDPDRFSNTMRFYNKGGRGINIEPNPMLISRLKKSKPNDINIGIGIGRNKACLDFYHFFPHTLSTFDKETANKYINSGFRLIETMPVKVRPLSDVLAEYAAGNIIDILSIDVEGFEKEVLSSSNWDTWRPRLVIIEVADFAAKSTRFDETYGFFRSVNYELVYYNGLNAFFLDSNMHSGGKD